MEEMPIVKDLGYHRTFNEFSEHFSRGVKNNGKVLIVPFDLMEVSSSFVKSSANPINQKTKTRTVCLSTRIYELAGLLPVSTSIARRNCYH